MYVVNTSFWFANKCIKYLIPFCVVSLAQYISDKHVITLQIAAKERQKIHVLYILLQALLELGYLQVSREKPWIPSIILDNPTNLHTSGLYIENECHRRCIGLFSKEWEHIVLEQFFIWFSCPTTCSFMWLPKGIRLHNFLS